MTISPGEDQVFGAKTTLTERFWVRIVVCAGQFVGGDKLHPYPFGNISFVVGLSPPANAQQVEKKSRNLSIILRPTSSRQPGSCQRHKLQDDGRHKLDRIHFEILFVNIRVNSWLISIQTFSYTALEKAALTEQQQRSSLAFSFWQHVVIKKVKGPVLLSNPQSNDLTHQPLFNTIYKKTRSI